MSEKDKNTKKGFGGIKRGLLKSLMTEEWINANLGSGAINNVENPDESTDKVVPVVEKKIIGKNKIVGSLNTDIHSSTVDTSSADVESVVEKIYGAIEKMNQPGIDFFEVYNAATEAGDGRLTEQSLNSTFKVLKSVQSDLTPAFLMQSGEGYLEKITQMMNTEMASRENERTALTDSIQNEKIQLANEVESLENQLREITEKLTRVRTELATVESKNIPAIQAVDNKIAVGKKAIEVVTKDFRAALDMLSKMK